jgi:hypothetical protein
MGLGLEETGSRPWTVYSYKSNSWEPQTGIEVRQVSPFGVNALEGVDGVNVDAKRANLLLLKDGVVRLPRILGLDKFQDAFELRCNLGHAANCMEENEHLANNLRHMIVTSRPKDYQARKKKLFAMVRTIQTIQTIKGMVDDKSNQFIEVTNSGKPREAARVRTGDSTTSQVTDHAMTRVGSDTHWHDRHDTISDQILELQDELTDIEATFRPCKHCAGHFTRDVDRRGPPPEIPKKTSLQKDYEKLAYFSANEIRPALREALSAAVAASYGTIEADPSIVKQSIMQQLESAPHNFFTTKVQKMAELPSELESEVTIKRSKARSELIVNLKAELMANQQVAGTDSHVDLHILIMKRKEVFDKV